MKRFRIDFVVRELDVPDDQSRGISFGDDVPLDGIFDFFNRCRDAVSALFVAPPNKTRPNIVDGDRAREALKKLNALGKVAQQQQPHQKPMDPHLHQPGGLDKQFSKFFKGGENLQSSQIVDIESLKRTCGL